MPCFWKNGRQNVHPSRSIGCLFFNHPTNNLRCCFVPLAIPFLVNFYWFFPSFLWTNSSVFIGILSILVSFSEVMQDRNIRISWPLGRGATQHLKQPVSCTTRLQRESQCCTLQISCIATDILNLYGVIALIALLKQSSQHHHLKVMTSCASPLSLCYHFSPRWFPVQNSNRKCFSHVHVQTKGVYLIFRCSWNEWVY